MFNRFPSIKRCKVLRLIEFCNGCYTIVPPLAIVTQRFGPLGWNILGRFNTVDYECVLGVVCASSYKRPVMLSSHLNYL